MLRDSNKEPEGIKCSLKRPSISALSDILCESLRMNGGSSMPALFPAKDLIVFQNLKGLFRLFVVSIRKLSALAFLIAIVHELQSPEEQPVRIQACFPGFFPGLIALTKRTG